MAPSPPRNWRERIEPFTRPAFHTLARMTRGMTLGVRGMAVDGHGRILLVRHTYLPDWWLPGGGVDRGESLHDALVREMREETGLVLTGPATLLSIHSNEAHFRGDHVAVYLVRDFTTGPASQHGEIAEVGWFAPNALPDALSRGSRARLAEYLDGVPADLRW